MAYNVLLVDDSSLFRKVLMRTFELASIPVSNFFHAENGEVGLNMLRENWVDLVLLDINMPVMDGMEFMKEGNKHELLNSVPVIIVSTEGSDERKKSLLEAGVKAYLRKPITPEDLVDAVTKLFGRIPNE